MAVASTRRVTDLHGASRIFTAFTACFTEIVLTDYTEEGLIDIDPRLVVLARFTLTAKAENTTQIISKGRKWKETITKVFPINIDFHIFVFTRLEGEGCTVVEDRLFTL